MSHQTHDWIKTTATSSTKGRPLLIVYARLATTANVNLTTDVDDGSTIDGVTVAAGDVLLIKDHATGATKGLYVAPAAAGTAVRHHLMPVGAEVHGVCVRVLEGTANGNKTFWCRAAEGAATVGTDSLTFATDSGGGGISDGDTLATGLTFPNTGLHVLDTNASHDLIIAPGSDLTADRTLTVTTGDADRTLTISGSTTLGGGSHSGTNTGDETAAGILAKLVTVDGAGSGLDADLLDGQSSAAFLAAANNLSDVANAGTARTNLGLAIGTDVQGYDATLAALAAFNTNGLVTQTAADTFAGRTITGTANEISVADGDGVSGNPTLSLPATIDLGGKTSLEIPNGTSPTVDAAGEIAIDTDADGNLIDQGLIVYHDGVQKMYVVAVDTLPSTDTHALVYDATLDKFKFAAQSGGGGNSFTTIAVSGQSDVVADSSTDTLTLVAGTGVTITTNAGTDTITIAASGGAAASLNELMLLGG